MHPMLKLVTGHAVLLALALVVNVAVNGGVPHEKQIFPYTMILATCGMLWAVLGVPRFWLRSLLLAMASAAGFCIYMMRALIIWSQEHDAWCEGCEFLALFIIVIMILFVLVSGTIARAIARRSNAYRKRMQE